MRTTTRRTHRVETAGVVPFDLPEPDPRTRPSAADVHWPRRDDAGSRSVTETAAPRGVVVDAAAVLGA